MTETVDVAVVGYGPVGVAAAALAAQRGLRVAAFERERDVYHLPRAANFDAEIMRVWQQLGCAEAILPCAVPGAGMHFVDAAGKKLFGIDAEEGEGRNGWAEHYLFYQPDLEHALRARATELGVAAHLGHEVLAIEQQDGDAHATIRVRDLASDTQHTVRARAVLGCDGARSLARTAIGATLEDLRFDQPWLVVDTELVRDVELPRVAIQYCDPERPMTFVPMAGRRRRWEFMLMAGDTREAMEQPARVRELLSRFISPDDVTVVRAVVYTFHALIVRPWRRGRLFLLGDAAHQMPPFLGQGMCAGIRDAANLVWKLDLVLRGRAGEALLDSYESERSPHVRAIIGAAVGAGNLIQTTDPAVAALRDQHIAKAGGMPVPREMVPGLATGLLDGSSAGIAGRMLAQPRCSDGVRLDERLGPGFAVVSHDDPRDALSARARDAWQRLGARFVTTDALDAWLAGHGASAVVVRPDRYVYAIARTPGDLERIAGDLCAALGSIRA
jgi:3-(3-hydroxy-phenyl)propionate hydroxylase